jgi:hypothetical protein
MNDQDKTIGSTTSIRLRNDTGNASVVVVGGHSPVNLLLSPLREVFRNALNLLHYFFVRNALQEIAWKTFQGSAKLIEYVKLYTAFSILNFLQPLQGHTHATSQLILGNPS